MQSLPRSPSNQEKVWGGGSAACGTPVSDHGVLSDRVLSGYGLGVAVTARGWRIHNEEMTKVTAAVLLASSLIATGVRAEEPDGNYTFATKAEALQRAKEMGCEGAYEWFGVWSPCEEDGGEDDHSGHDHSGHSH